jgi:hypothetical protein
MHTHDCKKDVASYPPSAVSCLNVCSGQLRYRTCHSIPLWPGEWWHQAIVVQRADSGIVSDYPFIVDFPIKNGDFP